ncbi:MAG TPA: energy-coupling factor transporter transmembrane component T [Clostridiales bacterium]|nr:energy-coupling factor transporter transmembrane component T [Clostridiales bacterium]
MLGNLLQADVEDRGLALDPRTKLLLLITMATFVLGGAGGAVTAFITPCLALIPLVLLLSVKKYRAAALYFFLYAGMYLSFSLFAPSTTGILNFLLLGTAGIITRFMPSIMMGFFVVSTTTVSEFTAAMLRMHVSEKLIIPASVMFRFFPTVADEFNSINAAMKMRGIVLGGNHPGKFVEYRLVPLLTCSVKIGEELSAAALTRGLGGNVRRTNVCEIGFGIQDFLMILLCAVSFVLLFLTRLHVL